MQMREHFVTIFDSLFLPQGIALHASMRRHVPDALLWILCVDDAAFEVLSAMALPEVRLLRLSRLETPELLHVKQGRSRGEYCWTLTPFAPRFVFDEDPSVLRVSYLDADLWFRKSPIAAFREFDATGKHVLITDHGYAPEYDKSAESGQYCVQFMTFARNGGEPVRKWWEGKCLEWCFARHERGLFGDQKYLDDWPERFADSVHVLEQKELMQAPWNAVRYPYGRCAVYHFHGLRLLEGGGALLPDKYHLPKVLLENVYRPYLEDLAQAVRQLRSVGFEARPQVERPGFYSRVTALPRLLYRNLVRGRQNREMKLPVG